MKEIIQSETFQKHLGGLAEDEQKLKTSPRAFSEEHPHIDLLRYKNIIAKIDITQKEVASDDFVDLVEETYLALQPFTAYLEKAASVE